MSRSPEVQTPGCNPASTNQTKDAAIIADASFCGNPGGRIEAIKAQLASHGVSLFILHDGSFIASKWNLTRPLADLHAVANFARQIGGAA